MDLLSAVSKHHKYLNRSFNWMRILTYFQLWADLTQERKAALEAKQPTFPSCVWTAIYFLLRQLRFTSLSHQALSFHVLTWVQRTYALMSSFNGIKYACNNPRKPWWFTAFTEESDTVNNYRRKLPSTFHYRWKWNSRINFHLLPGSFWFLLKPPKIFLKYML